MIHKERMKEMNKQKMKRNALEALMIAVFMVSVLCIEASPIMSWVGMGTSALALALMD